MLFTCETLSEEEQLASVKARFNLDVQPGIKVGHHMVKDTRMHMHVLSAAAPAYTIMQAYASVQSDMCRLIHVVLLHTALTQYNVC